MARNGYWVIKNTRDTVINTHNWQVNEYENAMLTCIRWRLRSWLKVVWVTEGRIVLLFRMSFVCCDTFIKIRRQQPVLKIVKSTVEIDYIWHESQWDGGIDESCCVLVRTSEPQQHTNAPPRTNSPRISKPAKLASSSSSSPFWSPSCLKNHKLHLSYVSLPL